MSIDCGTCVRARLFAAVVFLFTFGWPATAGAQTETLTVITGGQRVGHLTATTVQGRITIDFDYKNNGRGPTFAETLTLDASGLPTSWRITGSTTFGSKVDERFTLNGTAAEWVDSTGRGTVALRAPAVYVPQSTSPWTVGLIARAILARGGAPLPALPAGTLTLEPGETLTVPGQPAPARVTAYALSGTDLLPDYFLLDGSRQLFAYITPTFVAVRAGYEGDEKNLRALAAKMAGERLIAIQQHTAHHYESPIRIRNVRVFDPRSKTLSPSASVVVHGRTIAAIAPLDSPATPGEVTIDGGGGTLVPGLFEMHAHLDENDALLNLIAGITSVRDMGNDNAVLDRLVAHIEDGTLAGPRVTRSCFIEGKSPFNANNGILVESEAQAIDAVRWCGARGFWQIKIYNSMNPAWVPAMVREAHALGMRVAGHVPAFSTADAMIAAGYDEITHANQFMLGWVLKPGEDTRTLLRLTAMKRFPEVDLTAVSVQRTINSMIERKITIDPTLAIHEELTLNRNGVVPPGAVDYLDHMPIGYQRTAKRARTDVTADGDDRAYRLSLDSIVATMKLLHERGVLIVPGTDLGGSFTYHRELELLQRVGMTPGEVLARATLEMARYLGQEQRLGSIDKGKLADFFLVPGDPTADLKAIKTISMVVKDGVVYFPAEIYPKFGIAPFVTAPAVTAPSK